MGANHAKAQGRRVSAKAKLNSVEGQEEAHDNYPLVKSFADDLLSKDQNLNISNSAGEFPAKVYVTEAFKEDIIDLACLTPP